MIKSENTLCDYYLNFKNSNLINNPEYTDKYKYTFGWTG